MTNGKPEISISRVSGLRPFRPRFGMSCSEAAVHRSRLPHGEPAPRRNVLRCNRRYAKDHPQRTASSERALSRIPAVDHFGDIAMFDKFAPVCRRQALIDFARKPLVIIQEAFDRLLHKRFRRAALLRRHARQFSLLVEGQLHFHGFMILENRPSSNGLHGASLVLTEIPPMWFASAFF